MNAASLHLCVFILLIVGLVHVYYRCSTLLQAQPISNEHTNMYFSNIDDNYCW